MISTHAHVCRWLLLLLLLLDFLAQRGETQFALDNNNPIDRETSTSGDQSDDDAGGHKMERREPFAVLHFNQAGLRCCASYVLMEGGKIREERRRLGSCFLSLAITASETLRGDKQKNPWPFFAPSHLLVCSVLGFIYASEERNLPLLGPQGERSLSAIGERVENSLCSPFCVKKWKRER